MTKDIFKLYKRSFTDAYFFGYVSSLKDNVPGATNEKAVLNFMRKHGVSEENVKLRTLLSTYNRMNKEYFETQRTAEHG
jgi:hypothetical protein